MTKHDSLFLGGEWVLPSSSGRLEVCSPSTEEPIGSVPEASEEDVDRAVRAARTAFDASDWPRTPPPERAEVLRRIAKAMGDRRQDLVETLADEAGLPIDTWAAGSVDGALFMLGYYADLAASLSFEERRDGAFTPFIVRREPIGVVGVIVPWNSPVITTHQAIAPALAAGCTVVLKPAPETPLHAQILGQIYEEAGVPPGVINIVPGGRDVGEAVVRHPGIDKITFTGSSATGRRIATICGEQLKRTTLELGGKSAAIVLEDADLESVVPQLVFGAMMNNGEACVGQTRILVPRSRNDEITRALCDAVAALKTGDPHESGIDMGPLISDKQRFRVEGYIQIGREEGASLAVGGGRPNGLDRGWYVEPTVFTGVENGMRIAREEIFGPVVSLLPYGEEDDAVAIANDSPYGLSGSVWTSNPQRGLDVARRVRTGSFGINGMNMDLLAPIGGFKESGFGRQNGPEGLDEYFELKSIHLLSPEPA